MEASTVLLEGEDVLHKYAAELTQETGMIIVLFNLGQKEDQRLSLLSGSDPIVGGRSALSLPWGVAQRTDRHDRRPGWRARSAGCMLLVAPEWCRQDCESLG